MYCSYCGEDSGMYYQPESGVEYTNLEQAPSIYSSKGDDEVETIEDKVVNDTGVSESEDKSEEYHKIKYVRNWHPIMNKTTQRPISTLIYRGIIWSGF
jgi:hypothetical protein